MGIAAGCILAGSTPTVYMQNSGLFRIGDIVLSLYHAYSIPLPPLILSIRHSPHHHKFTGEKTRDYLSLLEYHNILEVEE